MKAYRFLGAARLDFDEATDWYDRQSAGLGDRFIDSLEEAITAIRQHPLSGVKLTKLIRRKVIPRFPYSILYVDEPDSIMIVAVAAQKRSPRYWITRLDNL